MSEPKWSMVTEKCVKNFPSTILQFFKKIWSILVFCLVAYEEISSSCIYFEVYVYKFHYSDVTGNLR